MKVSLRSKWFWILTVCVLGGVAFFFVCTEYTQLCAEASKVYSSLHNRYQLKRVIRSFGAYSPLVYIFVQIAQVIVAPIPGGAIEFMGGYLFGAMAGFVYSVIGLVIGSAIAFGLARIFEKVAVEKFVSPQIRNKFDYLVGHQGVIISFLLFLIPGFPKDALCYILGLTPMHWGIFLLISTIGRIPGTLMACFQGGKAFDHQYKALIILLGISTLVILVFYIYHNEIHHLIKRKKEKSGISNEGK